MFCASSNLAPAWRGIRIGRPSPKALEQLELPSVFGSGSGTGQVNGGVETLVWACQRSKCQERMPLAQVTSCPFQHDWLGAGLVQRGLACLSLSLGGVASKPLPQRVCRRLDSQANVRACEILMCKSTGRTKALVFCGFPLPVVYTPLGVTRRAVASCQRPLVFPKAVFSARELLGQHAGERLFKEGDP